MERGVLAAALVLAGCAPAGLIDDPIGPIRTIEAPDDVPIEPAPREVTDLVIRPARTDTIALSATAYALPAALAGDPTISVAALADGTTLAGGARGLFRLRAARFEPVDGARVHDLAAFDGLIVVAREGGLAIWDGALRASPLDDALRGAAITGLAAAGDELWLATARGLHVFDGRDLARFRDLPAAARVSTFDGGPVLMESGGGFSMLLRTGTTSWALRRMDDRPLARSAPGADGRTLAVERSGERALIERVSTTGGRASWRRVALTSTATDAGAAGVTALAVDPATGAVWVASEAGLDRVGPGRGQVAHLARPAPLGEMIAARVTADGALWLTDGVALARVGSAARPIGYAESVARFARDNCLRCHARTGGTARTPLDTYEAWVANIARIIAAVESKRMPADGAALRGDGALPRRWRDDGMRR